MQAQALEMLASFQAPIQFGRPDESEISLYRVQYALPYFWKSCWHTSLTQVVAMAVPDKLKVKATANREVRIPKMSRIEAYEYKIPSQRKEISKGTLSSYISGHGQAFLHVRISSSINPATYRARRNFCRSPAVMEFIPILRFRDHCCGVNK